MLEPVITVVFNGCTSLGLTAFRDSKQVPESGEDRMGLSGRSLGIASMKL